MTEKATMADCVVSETGFTLIELVVVLAILAILTSMAAVFHHQALAKAQAVEAEVALVEINRLETVYFANHGTYAGNLHALGFSSNSLLNYYKIDIQLHQGGAAFQATALPLTSSARQMAVVLTRNKNGEPTFQRVDPGTLPPPGGQSGSTTFSDQEPGRGMSETGGNEQKASCRTGGEATVAEDGLLDMNFCLR